MDITALKAIFAVATLCVCLLAGCLPVALLRTNKIPWQSDSTFKVIRGLLGVSLGVFLGICFVGLFPSAQEAQAELQRALGVDVRYPFAEVGILAGYFLFWLAAELTKIYYERRQSSEEATELQEVEKSPNYNSLTSCHDVGHGPTGGPISFFDLLLIIISLSIKSVLESVTIGSFTDRTMIVQMGCAKLVHEAICTLVMALNLANAFHKSAAFVSHFIIIIFALMNAGGFLIGIALGADVSSAAIISKFILKALAGGAMLCVVMTLFVHLNRTSEPTDVSAGVKFTCVLSGFLLFAIVRSIHTLASGPLGHEGAMLEDGASMTTHKPM